VRLLAADGRLKNAKAVKSWSVTIPQGVREVVGRRLDRLSADCNAALTVASVVGREFGLDVLERVSDLAADRLLDVLDEAVAARIVIEDPRAVGRYSFAHALVRETLEEELTATRRLRLHRRIAEALEHVHGAKPEAYLAEMAYHYFAVARGGGEAAKAMHYCARAGERAMALLAYEDAAGHYERALETLELGGQSGQPENGATARRCELLLALGEARNRAGDRESAKAACAEAAALARKLGATESFARAALGFGGRRIGIADARGEDRELVELIEESLQSLAGDSILRARLLARLAEEQYFTAAAERREALVADAIAIARRIDDPVTLGEVLFSAHMAVWGPRNSRERLAMADEIVKLAEAGRDQELALAGRLWRLVDLLELGESGPLQSELEMLGRLARESRSPFWEHYALRLQATRAIDAGRLDDAERLAVEALVLGQRISEADSTLSFGGQIAVVRWAQGRLAEVEAAAGAMAAQYPTLKSFAATDAFVKREQGRDAEAREIFERQAANDFSDIDPDAQYLGCLGFLAQVCAALGDRRRASTLYRALTPFANCNAVMGFGGSCFGSVARVLGSLATTLEHWPEAEAHFEAALAMNAKIGATMWVLLTQHDYASMLLMRSEPGDRERALRLLAQALSTAQELGLTRLVDMCLALKLRAQGRSADDGRTSLDVVAAAAVRDRPDLRPHAAPDGTVTILFTDIEGSTAMTERLGDRAAQEILRAHNEIVRRYVATHGGFEVKSQGDGFMLAFQSASRALRCAIAVQRAITTYGRQHPEEPIRVRIGLHTGEALKEGDDFFGKNVILAARIGAHARGGEILVSSLLKQLTESAGEFEFGPEQAVSLKGLAGTHVLHTVDWVSWAPPAAGPLS
jgi:class 3 adenylate cyclase